ncbi:hypothetical protein HGM15179_018585 [Zosterops borbonicus]|uniref:Uncharacterized protein n=1 Tax=Zosterops borbonicus TaxID=364589 RepID=A0A8K1FVX0_9PASS|nr:hypothetical protein HGM15179_018585 [Zosterops borbonicus]
MVKQTVPLKPMEIQGDAKIHLQPMGEVPMLEQVIHHDVYPNDIVTWCVIFSALQQFKEVDHVASDEPLSSPSEKDDSEHQDPFDLGLVDPDQEPDLYSPLTPIHIMAATTPSVEEILQTACQMAAATLSPTHPPPYATSHLANDDEDMLPTEPEPEGSYIATAGEPYKREILNFYKLCL